MTSNEIAALPELAAAINADHRQVREALGHALKSAMNAGDKLRMAKSQLPHGEWMPWLEANCDVSGRTARLYMQLAEERERIETNWQQVAILSFQEVVSWLQPALPEPRKAAWTKEEDREFEQEVAWWFHRSIWWVRHCMMWAQLGKDKSEARKKERQGRWTKVRQRRLDAFKARWSRLQGLPELLAEVIEAFKQRQRFDLAAIKFNAVRAQRECELLNRILEPLRPKPSGFRRRI
jgi:hypothetical protein